MLNPNWRFDGSVIDRGGLILAFDNFRNNRSYLLKNSEKQDDFLKSSFFDLQKLKKLREISPSRNLQTSKTELWKENHIKIVDRLKRQQQLSNDKYNPPSFKKVS